jgi:hypothetical protein
MICRHEFPCTNRILEIHQYMLVSIGPLSTAISCCLSCNFRCSRAEPYDYLTASASDRHNANTVLQATLTTFSTFSSGANILRITALKRPVGETSSFEGVVFTATKHLKEWQLLLTNQMQLSTLPTQYTSTKATTNLCRCKAYA